MPPSSGQISFSYGGEEVVISAPEAGSTTDINLPFDFLKLDDKSFESRDEGTRYDKRICRCTVLLTPTEQAALNTLINSTARGKDLILTLPSASGFEPFGADKGDTGVFTVSLSYAATPKNQLSPFRYFKCDMIITNTGAFPAYALPTEIPEGAFVLGNVSYLRMPNSLFEPSQSYSVSVKFTEGNRAEYFDRGAGGDNAITKFILQCNRSKCAALLYYLTQVARASAFDMTTPDEFYVFGSDHGSADTYSVRMISNQISIRQNKYNDYELSLELQRIS